jgi:hypothetical protein
MDNNILTVDWNVPKNETGLVVIFVSKKESLGVDAFCLRNIF